MVLAGCLLCGGAARVGASEVMVVAAEFRLFSLCVALAVCRHVYSD